MNRTPGPYNIDSDVLRLRGDASVEPIAVDEDFWRKLAHGEFGNFHHEYLVSCHAFDRDWTSWEMHPHGDEMVCLLEGAVTFVLERDGEERSFELHRSGDFLIVPKGAWHTARVREPARMLFITAGEGTQHREITP